MKLYARFDFSSPVLAYYLGLYEEASMHFLIRYLKPEDSFVDVGANVGVYTMLAAGAAGARVHAFEPANTAYEALTQNVVLNTLGRRVTLHHNGVGACARKAHIAITHKGSGRVVDGDAGETLEPIDIVSLDEALGNDVPAAIKIDVEGYEEQVLRGAHHVLSSPQTDVVIVEATSRGDGSVDCVGRCVDILERLGFTMCTFDPHTNALIECLPGQPQFVGPNDENYLFVKDVETARWRIGERLGL